MNQIEYAKDICDFLLSLPEVKSCTLYGSLSSGDSDEYSDIDIEIDVSGIDNGIFATNIPDIFTQKYQVIFADYAPSLAPQQYVVSMALSNDNPFIMVDVKCTAIPHFETIQKEDIASLNHVVEHTLKLFIANLKHFIRGSDCYDDIKKMHSRLLEKSDEDDEYTLLYEVFEWLKANASEKYDDYLNSIEKYL